MSRIFAAVALGSVLLIGTGALASAHESTSTSNETFDAIAEIFATSIDISALLPLLLLAGLLLATLGVFSRA